jgi:hypothetical protein
LRCASQRIRSRSVMAVGVFFMAPAGRLEWPPTRLPAELLFDCRSSVAGSQLLISSNYEVSAPHSKRGVTTLLRSQAVGTQIL